MLFVRQHVVTIFPWETRKWIFVGFFLSAGMGFLFENTSRYQMMSFEKTNFLQRIREVFEIFLKIFASG